MKLFFLIFVTTYSVFSLEIGDECTLSSKNIRGKCAILKNCEAAISDLKRGIHPEICGYQNLESIVCCAEKPKLSIQVNIEKNINKSNRLSKQKCIEYGKSVYESKTILWMGGMKHENVSTCVSGTDTLTNGIYAKAKEFPHMALLGFGPEDDKEWMCSGILISEKFVLTVAHCTSNRDYGVVEWVRLGDLDYESPNDDSEFVDLRINSVHRHPLFRPPMFYNDIALLELEREISFTPYIRPACLYTGNDATLNKFILTGFIGRNVENKGHLRRAKGIKLIEYEECNKIYNVNNRRLKNGIDKDLMICTDEGPADICEISSGGPLQVNSEDVYCMYEVVGITSFGRPYCTGYPVVSVKVSGYIDWIESIVWPQTM